MQLTQDIVGSSTKLRNIAHLTTVARTPAQHHDQDFTSSLQLTPLNVSPNANFNILSKQRSNVTNSYNVRSSPTASLEIYSLLE